MEEKAVNPFTPNFGEAPAYLAGRDNIVDSLRLALTSPRRRPELSSIFYGARGTGKTALLSVASQIARENGWLVVRTSAVEGMLRDIELGLTRQAEHLITTNGGVQISKVGIPNLVEVELNHSPDASSWRYRMEDILDALDKYGTGVLVTVDEVDAELPELISLASYYQIFVGDNRKIGLMMAGLPHNVSQLTSQKSVSFLRRAQQFRLGRISDTDVKQALTKTVSDGGRTIQAAALDQAAQAIDGFAYMLQLVGFRSWEVHPNAEEITAADVEVGNSVARAELSDHILSATFRGLSKAEVKFVTAMLPDPLWSEVSEITQRVGWSSDQTAQYRRRLIDKGVIGEFSRGSVQFELPYFRQYVESMRNLD